MKKLRCFLGFHRDRCLLETKYLVDSIYMCTDCERGVTLGIFFNQIKIPHEQIKHLKTDYLKACAQ